jgi:formate--tetrahydrofolate ligase
MKMMHRAAEQAGAPRRSEHWAKGGDGALELADAVIDACKDKNDFTFIRSMKLRDAWPSSPRGLRCRRRSHPRRKPR